jgi:uncharacterized membrane protein YgdD (TMEM256/DUF423 family)
VHRRLLAPAIRVCAAALAHGHATSSSVSTTAFGADVHRMIDLLAARVTAGGIRSCPTSRTYRNGCFCVILLETMTVLVTSWIIRSHAHRVPRTIQTVDRTFLIVGALAGLVGVALGAFGAHGLRARLPPEMLAVFETGVRYQMYHACAILIVALAAARLDGWLIRGAGWSFALGILLFSGSLYTLALSRITLFGAVTPIGGVAFLIGWAFLIAAGLALTTTSMRPL